MLKIPKKKECLTGKHEFDIDSRCIHCKKTKVEIQDQHDLEFLEYMLNSTSKPEDKKILLDKLFKEQPYLKNLYEGMKKK